MLFTTFAGYLAGGVAGAILATLFVFLPSFVFVLGGAHYVEKVRDNKTIQAFLAGVSAAVVGVIAVVSLELIPEALAGWPAIVISHRFVSIDRVAEARCCAGGGRGDGWRPAIRTGPSVFMKAIATR
jgi:chromate transport protein ChrA